MSLSVLLWIIAALIVGFVTGALVFRKHAAEGERIVQQLKEARDDLRREAQELRNKNRNQP